MILIADEPSVPINSVIGGSSRGSLMLMHYLVGASYQIALSLTSTNGFADC